jgi:prolipoprotein diacylglyceryltransferase
LGTPTDLPWGIAQGGSVVARHPVEIYAALLLLGAALALIALKHRRPPPGVVAGLALAAAGAARLLTEPLRPVIGSGPELWYGGAVVVGVAATAASLVRHGRKRRRELPGVDG